MPSRIFRLDSSPKYLNFIFFIIIIFSQSKLFCQTRWFTKENIRFEIISTNEQSFLVNKILNDARISLNKLDSIFNFIPTEKIIFNTFDFSDFGYAGTTTVPENYIRLEIEPLELAYENIPIKNRINWLISHELVHVIVNDQATNIENTARSLFSKVIPEKQQPLTVLYSLLTNYNRYAPTWYQEGIAVFMETWENGGLGRVLGNFDEMYFRSLVYENSSFPSIHEIDSQLNELSFLQGTVFYLYGERFCTFLAIKYGTSKLINWYRNKPGEFYENYSDKFKEVYGLGLSKAWNQFIENEISFQSENINRIKKGQITEIRRISDKPVGWITKAYYDSTENCILFGYDTPGYLAGIEKLNLANNSFEKIGTLPTPSLFRVASTAYDNNSKLFFYTTKNNELFRDIRVLDTQTGSSKLLFPDCRTGDLTVSSKNHDLWGVVHTNGRTGIVYSLYPYKNLEPVVGFNLGDDVSDLAVSPDGHYLAGVLHRGDGSQIIFITSCDTLKTGHGFKYLTITDNGSPEFPSWSSDSKYLFWNAYINGVSNIYKKKISVPDSDIEPLSNVVDGLFKPVYLSKDSLFAFEFTAKGFFPVIIPNKEADFLPAIKYLGDEVVAKNPNVINWNLNSSINTSNNDTSAEKNYNSLGNLKIRTFIPVITGFQKQKVLGIYARISDPLLINDMIMEIGYSPFYQKKEISRFHFKGKYEYRKKLTLNYEYNPSDFYDLFNKRKRGLSGSRYGIEYSHYWIYDNPLKIIQKWGFDYYTGINFLTDNIIKVSQPDFAVAQTSLNSKDLRRSIGSVDFEEGNELNLALLGFGSLKNTNEAAAQVYGQWDNFSTWVVSHNIFHFQLTAGYAYNTKDLVQAKFYLGGFGNRYLEDQEVNQFRKPFSFSGIPIYSLGKDNFGKLLIENEFPPVRFSNLFIGNQYLSNFSISIYTQTLFSNPGKAEMWNNIGSQINIVFHHWYNLESTLSAGIAKTWYNNEQSWQWFISLKLLKN